jgi:hypothetical protein
MDPKRKLKGMLARIFSDAVVEDAERVELTEFLGSGLLSDDDIGEVIGDFAESTWNMTMADGVMTDRKRDRLRQIAKLLSLEKEALPPEWAAVLD